MTDIVNFTKSLLETVKPPKQGRIVLRDTKVQGLQCRISARGVKTFSVYRRVKGGESVRITIGRFPDLTIDQARTKALHHISKLAIGENPVEIRKRDNAELTFAGLFMQYLEAHAKPNKKSWKDDLAKYNLHLKKPLGSMKVKDISRVTIRTLQIELQMKVREKDKIRSESLQKNVSGSYVNRVLALISSIFGWAITLSFCEYNPVHGVKRSKEQSRERFLQTDEMPRFFKALEAEENEDVRDFIVIALFTGARKMNVLTMRWQDVSLERREWVIPHTKNGSSLTVPLTDEVMKVLKRRKENMSPYVLNGTGRRGHMAEPRKGFHRILKRAEIENMRIHDLRRTIGSWQAKTGASLLIVGKSLGHKSPQSTLIYSRLDVEPVRKSLDVASKAILSASRQIKLTGTFKAAATIKKVYNFTFESLLRA